VSLPAAEVALATEDTLLILKIGFLALLYLFILYIVRSATRDIGEAPQESIILGAKEAAAVRAEHGIAETPRAVARFVVLDGPGLSEGREIELTPPAVVGREAPNGIPLAEDEFASGHHARIDVRTDGIWVEDLGSTNGTFVNGGRVSAERLEPGDVLRIGQTELVFEP
jgi:pSer/pThr/pTyr-binding forkhead associated (FHA) protein